MTLRPILSFIGRYTLALSAGSVIGLCVLALTTPLAQITRADGMLWGYGGAAVVALACWLVGRRA